MIQAGVVVAAMAAPTGSIGRGGRGQGPLLQELLDAFAESQRRWVFAVRIGRELLAELHAPLVERIDAPDDALDEDLVLVERDQLAENLGRQLCEQNHVARVVALMHAVRLEAFFVEAVHERFCLRQAVVDGQVLLRLRGAG